MCVGRETDVLACSGEAAARHSRLWNTIFGHFLRFIDVSTAERIQTLTQRRQTKPRIGIIQIVSSPKFPVYFEMCTCKRGREHTYKYKDTCVYIYIFTYTCIYRYIYIHMCTCIQEYIKIYIQEYIYIQICKYI